MKYSGLSISTIDAVCHVFGDDYLITQPSNPMGPYLHLSDAADFPETSPDLGLADGNSGTVGGLLYFGNTDQYPDSDITVIFYTYIGPGYIWLLQNLFAKFTTAPQINFVQG